MPTWDDWVRVCYHEAGHAVVTLAVSNAPAPIVLRCTNRDGALQAEGTFQLPVRIDLDNLRENPPLQLVMRCAAGGMVEEIQFGNRSDGVTGDWAKIRNVVAFSKNVLRNTDPEREQQDDFPATRAVLRVNWPAVVRIAAIAIRRFEPLLPEETAFENIQVLSAGAVRRIHLNDALSPVEHARALVGAYYYSLARGDGAEPLFNPQSAVDDFEKAAGDVLTATA